MVMLFGMLMGSGMVVGPALYNAFPIWHIFIDAIDALVSANPAIIDVCYNICTQLNSTVFDTLFEMIFS